MKVPVLLMVTGPDDGLSLLFLKEIDLKSLEIGSMVFDEAFPKGIAIFDSERPANYDLNALSLPKDKNKPILKFKFNNSQTKLEEWIEELKSLGWVQI